EHPGLSPQAARQPQWRGPGGAGDREEMKRQRSLFPAAVLGLLLTLTSCRSRVVRVNLVNTSTEPVSTIIVDYPTATFGKNKLAPGETFSYTIKPLETGPLKLQFTDARGAIHTYSGLTLHQNDDGAIDVKIDQDRAVITPSITSR